MILPQKHPQEPSRIKAVQSYSILDTLPEEELDGLTAIAAEICGTSISLVSIIDEDRQWFKSRHGLDATETHRDFAFCAHAICDAENVLIVRDARDDDRFHDNPLVVGDPHVIFYAGVPLISDDGLPLGTLCVIDQQPKELSRGQLKSLIALSKQVVTNLQLRKNNRLLGEVNQRLEEKNFELDRFAFIAAHDIKSPLRNISNMSKVLMLDYASKLDSNGEWMLGLIVGASIKLHQLVDGLLHHSRSESISKEQKTNVELKALVNEISGLFTFDQKVEFELESSLEEVCINKTAVEQILINLVANAIKYNDKSTVEIRISVADTSMHYQIEVADNGPGIAKQNHEKLFQLFEIATEKDKFGEKGNGIGLATVKRLAEGLGGSVAVESEIGEGAKFTFTMAK